MKETQKTVESIDERIYEHRDRDLFNEIAERYCKKDLETASRLARKHRLSKTLDILPKDKHTRVLEVGCGGGFSAQYLKGCYHRFVGVDYSEKLISYAKEYNCWHNVEFHAKNINDYHPEKPFDVILMIGVLHHFDHVESSFSNIVGNLKPGGWIVVNEPQSANLIVKLLRKLRSKFDTSYSSSQLTFSARELYKLYDNVGLKNIEIMPQGVFTTPFAEVTFKLQFFFKPLVSSLVHLDNGLENLFGRYLIPFSWNLIVAGQRI